MGRWLARLRDIEKNSERLRDETDKTDKTPCEPVSSVLSVRHQGVAENFAPDASDLAVEFEERAGILEYDAGLSRAEAERLAREHVENVVAFRRRR